MEQVCTDVNRMERTKESGEGKEAGASEGGERGLYG
jgi:hypothetical protein